MMRNNKWMLLAAGLVFATTGGIAACDEATTCETDEDCDTEGGEVCDVAEGVCEIPCESDADCDADAGEVCCASGDVQTCAADCGGEGGSGGGGEGEGGEGGNGDNCGGCPDGQVCGVDDTCRPGCATDADCYDLIAYCASDSACYGVDAGEPGNTCDRVDNVNPGFETNGPVIYGAAQVSIGEGGDRCAKEPATCTNNGNVCSFNVFFYDPDNDVPTGGALYNKLFFVQENGSTVVTYGPPENDGSSITLTLCYPETATTLGGAVQLEDNAGNRSNPLCLEGSAP